MFNSKPSFKDRLQETANKQMETQLKDLTLNLESDLTKAAEEGKFELDVSVKNTPLGIALEDWLDERELDYHFLIDASDKITVKISWEE